MFDALRRLLGTAGHNLAEAPNNVSRALTGHPLEGAPVDHNPIPQAVGGYLMDTKASPIGQNSNSAYNQAVNNRNQNLVNHVASLQVTPANQWQTGNLSVQPTIQNPGGSFVSPFDTDTQGVNPFQFGSRTNYQAYTPDPNQVQTLLRRN